VGWVTPQFLVLGGTGSRPLKRVTKTTAINNSYYLYVKFMEKSRYRIRVFLGSDVSKNLGLSTFNNEYGNRGFVLVRNFENKGS